jgi:peptidylprolyl isomerase
MKHIGLILLAAAIPVACLAQTSQKPAAPIATVAKPHTAAGASTTPATLPPWIKLPPGVPRVAHGPVQVPFSLRYEDIKIGTGAEAQYRKLDTVHYTLWIAADGRKVDSSLTRQEQVFDEKHKPVMGDDDKPKLTDPHPEPFQFIQGDPRLIPGWNLGVDGMKVGGKRRIFIPWQMAYGVPGRPSADPDHPGIPAKADLIFDIELLDVKDMPTQANRPPMSVAPHPATPAQPAPSSAQPQPGVHVVPVTPPASAMPAPATPPPATTAPATPPQTAPPQPK